MLCELESVTSYVYLGLYMCCKLFWMCIMPNPKKPNIHIEFVIHTPNPWAINFQWTKDYEPIGPQPVVHWKEMCIIQTLGSFPMSKNWGLSSPQCFAHWEDKLMSLLGVPPPSRMPTKNQTKTISLNHSWYTLRNIYNKCEVAGTDRKKTCQFIQHILNF